MFVKKLVSVILFFTLFIISALFSGSITLAVSLSFDSFEYFDTPLNRGWMTSDPPYPIYGYGVGTGNVGTVIDFNEGSRVLEVNSTPSIFNQLEPYTIYNFNLTNSLTGSLVNQKVVSFKIRAPFEVEYFALFQFCVAVTTTTDEARTLVYRPVNGPEPVLKGDIIEVCLGRQYQDGTWHLIARNMDEDIGAAMPGVGLKEVRGIIIKGNSYRLDEIAFHDDMNFINNHPPELWRIGPQFATLFSPFQYLVAARDMDGDFLDFVITIGGYGANGTPTDNLAYRLPLDPNNPSAGPAPDVVIMQFIPQVLEDLIVTVRVTDGQLSDVETFPLSVVNYPMAGMNHPPLLEELNDAVARVGEEFSYNVLARDPDYGDIITYSATINGLPSYQFGPWNVNIINPITGRISFTPLFEGEFRIVVTIRDSRGMVTQGGFNLIVATTGTFLNHDPILTTRIQDPQVAFSGVPFSIPIGFTDPDGDKLNYSCSIGSITERVDGEQGAVFSFLTYFPGQYIVTITAYDDRGGVNDQTFFLDVQPWWSY